MRDYERVGGGVQVGNINVDLLVLQSGHGADLGHEEDDVAHVDVVAETVEDEEQVGPVLSGAGIYWGGDLSFDFLLFLFGFLNFLWFIIFAVSVLLGNFSVLCSRLCCCLLLGLSILLSCVTVLCCDFFFNLFGFFFFLLFFNFLGFFLFGSKKTAMSYVAPFNLMSSTLPPKSFCKITTYDLTNFGVFSHLMLLADRRLMISLGLSCFLV